MLLSKHLFCPTTGSSVKQFLMRFFEQKNNAKVNKELQKKHNFFNFLNILEPRQTSHQNRNCQTGTAIKGIFIHVSALNFTRILEERGRLLNKIKLCYLHSFWFFLINFHLTNNPPIVYQSNFQLESCLRLFLNAFFMFSGAKRLLHLSSLFQALLL